MHLKFHQYVHEKMAVFKWVPSILGFALLKGNIIGLLLPIAWVKFVDHYFKDFYIWREAQNKIINLRREFSGKLCKENSIT